MREGVVMVMIVW